MFRTTGRLEVPALAVLLLAVAQHAIASDKGYVITRVEHPALTAEPPQQSGIKNEQITSFQLSGSGGESHNPGAVAMETTTLQSEGLDTK